MALAPARPARCASEASTWRRWRQLIAERNEARKAKDFARGGRDPRRAEDAKGVEMLDTPTGTDWRVLPG